MSESDKAILELVGDVRVAKALVKIRDELREEVLDTIRKNKSEYRNGDSSWQCVVLTCLEIDLMERWGMR